MNKNNITEIIGEEFIHRVNNYSNGIDRNFNNRLAIITKKESECHKIGENVKIYLQKNGFNKIIVDTHWDNNKNMCNIFVRPCYH
jgi:hypothetical protein